MPHRKVYCAGVTPAAGYARAALLEAGIPVADAPGWDTSHLLLDVPSFRTGQWTAEALDTLLSSLPRDVTVWGGGLEEGSLCGLRIVDFLKDQQYLQENAEITAKCTIPIVQDHLKQPWTNTTALILGWGRICRALAPLLREKGCRVLVASGSKGHRQEATSAGYEATDYAACGPHLPGCSLLVNTAPAVCLPPDSMKKCPCGCVKIDLASQKGLSGADVIWARALPGRFAPEDSGQLIARTFLRIRKERQL